MVPYRHIGELDELDDDELADGEIVPVAGDELDDEALAELVELMEGARAGVSERDVLAERNAESRWTGRTKTLTRPAVDVHAAAVDVDAATRGTDSGSRTRAVLRFACRRR